MTKSAPHGPRSVLAQELENDPERKQRFLARVARYREQTREDCEMLARSTQLTEEERREIID